MSGRCSCGHAAGSHSWHQGRCLLCPCRTLATTVSLPRQARIDEFATGAMA
jgi:hypothetical protein